MIKIISFDCRKCGAPLEVQTDAVAVICRYCGSHHKLAFTDGILTAELIKKVGEHDQRLFSLEERQSQHEDVIRRTLMLTEINAEISRFLESHHDFDPSDAVRRTPGTEFIPGCGCAVIPFALFILFLFSDMHVIFHIISGVSFLIISASAFRFYIKEITAKKYFELIDKRDAIISGDVNGSDSATKL